MFLYTSVLAFYNQANPAQMSRNASTIILSSPQKSRILCLVIMQKVMLNAKHPEVFISGYTRYNATIEE